MHGVRITVCLMQLSNRLFLILLVSLALGMTACTADEAGTDADTDSHSDSNGTPEPGDAGVEFMGLTFLLESSEGFEPVEGSTIRLGFREGEMSELGFTLHAGCNSMSGDFTLEEGVMNVAGMMMTEMGCEQELMEQDNQLIAFMQSSPGFDFNNNRVTLTGSDTILVFLDRTLADPDRSLAGPLWTIDTFNEGGASTAMFLETSPTVTFDEDGTVSVDTGCNTGGGDYSVEGSTITFSPIMYTRVACMDEDAAWAEAHVQSVLGEGSVTYRIQANRLTLDGAEKGLSATTE